jgi:hypothetical protein
MIARLSFALALVLALILQSSALPSLEGDELLMGKSGAIAPALPTGLPTF